MDGIVILASYEHHFIRVYENLVCNIQLIIYIDSVDLIKKEWELELLHTTIFCFIELQNQSKQLFSSLKPTQER